MIRLDLRQAATLLDARAIGACEFVGVSIDTRTLQPGNLFAAVRGEHFDGHRFADQARLAGASALLVERSLECELPQLIVDDTRTALGELARAWRQRFAIPLVGITGSNGKTTVKEMLGAILGEVGPVLSTRGNLNNELGVPLTLFGLSDEHRFAVIEMGANHVGEIRRLARIAEPDIGLITCIAGVHLEGFGSLDGVATGKSELFTSLPADGWAVVNADDAYVDQLRDASRHCHRFEFGTADEVGLRLGCGDTLEFRTSLSARAISVPEFRLIGAHNRFNALAAAAAALCVGAPESAIVNGLARVRAAPGRLERKSGVGGATLIDDSYNANPDSARAGIDVLADCRGARHLVLGDMGELGDAAAELHRGVGEHARTAGIDGLWATGELAREARLGFIGTKASDHARDSRRGVSAEPMGTPVASSADTSGRRHDGGHFDSRDALVEELRPQLGADWTVLVKGSRSSRMDEVVSALSVVETQS